MKITAPEKPEAIEAGTYPATFLRVEDGGEGEFGPYWIWWFLVEAGDGAITTVSGASSTKFGPRAKAHQWTKALIGRSIEAGETIDFDTLPGRDCSLVLSINENDFNAIDSVVTAEQGSGPGIDEEPF